MDLLTVTAPPSRRTARTRLIPTPLRRIGHMTVTVLVVVLTLLAGLTVGVPLVTGTKTYTIITGSMRPDIPPGHVVGVRPTETAELRVGDVITFRLHDDDPTVVTHRIVGFVSSADGARSFVTRGDANVAADTAPVSAAQIEGRVVYVIPWLGLATAWLSPAARSGLVMLIGAVLLTGGVVSMIRGIRRRPVRRRDTRRRTSSEDGDRPKPDGDTDSAITPSRRGA